MLSILKPNFLMQTKTAGEQPPMGNVVRALWIYAVLLGLMVTMMLHVGQASPVKRLPLYHPQQNLQSSEYYDLAVASTLIHQNQCAEALAHLQAATEKNPNNIIAYYNQGTCYFQMAKTAVDRDTFDHYMAQSRQAYERVQLLDPSLTVIYFKLGKIAVTQNQPEAAIRIYRQGLDTDTDNAALYFNLAGVYDSQAQYDQAISYYLQALEKEPTFFYAYNNLGLAYEATQQYDKAEMAYHSALKIKPDYTYARLNLGNLLAQQDLFKAAKQEYTTVLADTPDNAWAYLYLGNVYYQEGDVDRALEAYQQSQRLNPGYAPIYYLQAIAFQKLSKAPEALVAGMTYLNLSPQGKYADEMAEMVRTLRVHQAKATSTPSSLVDCAVNEKICHAQ